MYVDDLFSSTASKAHCTCLIIVNTALSNTAATSTAKVYFMVPFPGNGDFIGRQEYIQSLEEKLCVPNEYCRVALVGIGGIGYVTCSTYLSIPPFASMLILP